MPRLSLPAVLLLLGSPAAASTTTLMGVDVYGTARFSAQDVQSRFREDIRDLVSSHALKDRSKTAAALAEELHKGLEEKIRSAWQLPWTRLSWVEHKDGGQRFYLMLDVIEEVDLKARLPFRSPPAQALEDPAGLLEAWHAYTKLGWELARGGIIKLDRASCPAFYCLWGSQTPELQKYEDRFVKEVPSKKDVLMKTLAEDKDPLHRVAAAYLLSYIRNGNGLSNLLQSALKDPDIEVRAAALRVYNDLAIYHKNLHLPVDQLAAALDYPMVEDRSRALAVMVSLADHPTYRSILVKDVAPAALRLLKLKSPSNHDLAYAFLGLLSKKEYADTDFEAWESWVEKARSGRKRR